jgi:ATP-binding cassette subfamily F protein 3
MGHNVITAYYAQYVLDLLNPNNNIIEELHQSAPQESELNLRRNLGGFLFSGDDILKPIRVLCGGETARVALAKMLLQPSNLLLMDEPTNHLDILSREILADALNDYQGTLCLITHDRTIMQQVANKIIEIDTGRPTIFLGDYDSYIYKKETNAKLMEAQAQFRVQTEKSHTSESKQPVLTDKQRAREENERQKQMKRQATKMAKRMAEIDSVLPKLETQVAELQGLFSNPKYYGDAGQIADFSEEYRLINEEIHALIEEWDQLSTESERINKEIESNGQTKPVFES